MTRADGDPTMRAVRLRDAAIESPGTVDVDEIRALLFDPALPPDAHEAAVVALLNVAGSGEPIDESLVEAVARLLGRPSLDADPLVLRCLRQLAMDAPAVVLDAREAICERITTEDDEATQAATGCCVELVGEDPAAFVDLIPTLSTLLDAEDPTRTNAIYLLSQLAVTYPEAVKPVVPQLVDGISDRNVAYQTNALSTLGAIASTYPTVALEAVDELSALLDADHASVRGNAVGLLADVAQEHPDAVLESAGPLVDLLDDADDYVRGNAVSAVLHVGVEHPDAVTGATPGLVASLEDPEPIVRRNACKAIGSLDVEDARGRLDTLADEDADAGVRELAEWALTQLR